jgi:ATP-binding cassette subfamily F protein 3
MLKLENITVEFNGTPLLKNISFHLNEGEKVALCGRNGSGKSTLLKVITGEILPDEGKVHIQQGKKVRILKQFLKVNEDKSVLEECISGFEEIQKIKKEIREIEYRIKENTSDDIKLKLAEDLSQKYHQLEILNVNEVEKTSVQVLYGLGFNKKTIDTRLSELSGGWRMRVELAKLLVSKPDCILLDEPTNHLDVSSILWLENYLKIYKGTLILISHDRTFLDYCTNRTIEIVKGKIHDYPCNYSKYVVLRDERMAQLKREQINRERYIKKTQELIDKFRYKASKAAFAQSLIHKLEKMETTDMIDELTDVSEFDIRFLNPAHCGKVVYEIQDLSKSYGDFPVFSDVNFTIAKGERIALLGKNGKGKSTFMKILCGKEPPTSGKIKIGHQVLTGMYLQGEESVMDEEKTVWQFIDEAAEGEIRKQIRNILGTFLFSGDDIHKKIKVLSGGERVRLLMCRLLLKPYNLLLLDEPTHHLDMASKDVLKKALLSYQGTYVLVSHDRDFLEGLYNRIFVCEDGRIKDFPGNLNDYLKSLTDQRIKENKPEIKTDNHEFVSEDLKEKNESKIQKTKKINAFKLERIENQIFEKEQQKKQLEEKMNKGAATDEDYFLYSNLDDELKKLYEEWENFF